MHEQSQGPVVATVMRFCLKLSLGPYNMSLRTAKALARLCLCAGLPEHFLAAYVISNFVYVLTYIEHWIILHKMIAGLKISFSPKRSRIIIKCLFYSYFFTDLWFEYLIESPQWGESNKYSNRMFLELLITLFWHKILLIVTFWAKVSCPSNCHHREFCRCIECQF